MNSIHNENISIEQFAAFLDGNLDREEQEWINSVISDNPQLEDIYQQAIQINAIDNFQYDDYTTNSTEYCIDDVVIPSIEGDEVSSHLQFDDDLLVSIGIRLETLPHDSIQCTEEEPTNDAEPDSSTNKEAFVYEEDEGMPSEDMLDNHHEGDMDLE